MSAAKSGAGRLIYVVDDELFLAQIMQAILQLEGFNVSLFTDPGVALESFKQTPEKPVLLLTDYAMAPLNGLDLIEQCCTLSPGLSTILISGNVGAEVFAQSSIRPHRFITKPFLPRMLIAEVRAVLDHVEVPDE